MFRPTRRTFVVLAAVALLVIGGIVAVLSVGTRPSTALADAAAQLRTVAGWTVSGHQVTDYAEGVEEPAGELEFVASYAAPDRLMYSISNPETALEYHLYEADGHLLHPAYDAQVSNAWVEVPAAASQGLDLASAVSLPDFLSGAEVVAERRAEIDGVDLIAIEAVGDAALYPAVIFRDYVEQTAPQVPFTAFIDPASGALHSLQLHPSELDDPGMAYVLTLTFVSHEVEEYLTREVTIVEDTGGH